MKRLLSGLALFGIATGALASDSAAASTVFAPNVNESLEQLKNHRDALEQLEAEWVRGFDEDVLTRIGQGTPDPDSDARLGAVKDAAEAGYKVVYSLKFNLDDQEGRGDVTDYLPGSAREQEMFSAVSELLDVMAPYLRVLVVGNEPFAETFPRSFSRTHQSDWGGSGVSGFPLVIFYDRVSDHILEHMRSDPEKFGHIDVYLGATQSLDNRTNTAINTWIKAFIEMVDRKEGILGLDVHIHTADLNGDVPDPNYPETRRNFEVVRHFTQKPLLVSEFSLVWRYRAFLEESLGASEEGIQFANEYGYDPGMKVYEYWNHAVDAETAGLPREEWVDFLDSRTWWEPNYLRDMHELFSENGVVLAAYRFIVAGRGTLGPGSNPWSFNAMVHKTLLRPDPDGTAGEGYAFAEDFRALNAGSESAGIWHGESGFWSDGLLWQGGLSPGGVDAAAVFSWPFLGRRTVVADREVTLGSILFDQAPNGRLVLGADPSDPNRILTLASSGGSPVIDVAEGVLEIFARLEGDAGFVKTGDGRLRLSRDPADAAPPPARSSPEPNGFTGTIELNGGFLELAGQDNAWGVDTDFVVTGDAGFWTDSEGTSEVNRDIVIEAGELTVFGASGGERSVSFGGGIAGTGGLTVDGETTEVILNGASSYEGATKVNAGTLALGSGGSIDGTSNLVVASNGTLDLGTADSLTVPHLRGAGAVLGGIAVIGGYLRPGTFGLEDSPDIGSELTVDRLTLSSSSGFRFDMDSRTGNSGRLRVTSDVHLDGAVLRAVDVAGIDEVAVAPGRRIVLVDYTGAELSGTFSRLSEGATLSPRLGGESGGESNLNVFTIRYNDFTDGERPGNFVTLATGETPYDRWVREAELTGDDRWPTADPEGDGVANRLEFVLDGDPLAPDAPGILPSGETIPGERGEPEAIAFTFFRRRDASDTVALAFAYTDDLESWTSVAVPAETGTSGNVSIEVSEENPDLDRVDITVPASGTGRLFARLRASAL